MDTIVGIYETVATNDWVVSGAKLALIGVLLVLIKKCVNVAIEDVTDTSLED